jgi:hypothetical protein
VLTRRRFLAAAAGRTLGGSGGGYLLDRLLLQSGAPEPLGAQPRGLPARQHAWNATLPRDAGGNVVVPRHVRLVLADLHDRPGAAGARRLEAALRTLERRFAWGPGGLLFSVGWGPRYFVHGLGLRTPIERPKPLSEFELPTLDDYDACLHLACDDAGRLDAVTAALVHGDALAGADGVVDLRPVLDVREVRTGFVGAGLPAGHQDVGGIPAGRPVGKQAPLFMGFHSGFGRNQATEDDVTIAGGPFAGGTTMHVSRMRLRLSSWYEDLDTGGRVARMFGPEVTPAEAARFTTDAASKPEALVRDARRYGVVGHAQASARARRNGRARILRRDFDTVDGGEAGLHFVALQRAIDDFVATRTAMNAARASQVNPEITDTVNNGINEFIFVTHRANYLVPPRAQRSFPLLPNRRAALGPA